MVKINRSRKYSIRLRKSRRSRHRKQKKLQGGRVNVNNCPRPGYHIYLRSMNPALRIEVNCDQLRERLDANIHDDIYIETPGPHNDDDERETVQTYFFGPGAYIVGRVSRPEALVRPGVHRQYARGMPVLYENLINHITEFINNDIQIRARPEPEALGVPPGPGPLPRPGGLPRNQIPVGIPGQGARHIAGDPRFAPERQWRVPERLNFLRPRGPQPEILRQAQLQNPFLAGFGPVIEGEGARARAGNQGPIIAGMRLQDINAQLAGNQLDQAQRNALINERHAIQMAVPPQLLNPEHNNNNMQNNRNV